MSSSSTAVPSSSQQPTQWADLHVNTQQERQRRYKDALNWNWTEQNPEEVVAFPPVTKEQSSVIGVDTYYSAQYLFDKLSILASRFEDAVTRIEKLEEEKEGLTK